MNFGCPVKKVLGRCRGGYHLSQPDVAVEILRDHALRERASEVTGFFFDRLVAIKCLNVETDDALGRFYREARAAGRLQHDNIVKVFDVGEVAGAAGVIASLVYLGRQVQAGTRASAVEAKLESTRLQSDQHRDRLSLSAETFGRHLLDLIGQN